MIAALVFSVVLPIFGGTPVDRSSRLPEIVRERARITSGEVVVRAKFLVHESAPEYSGADWELHYWFGSDGAYRLDRHRREPKRSDDPDHRDNASYDGRAYRLIDRRDNSIYPIREYRAKQPFFPPEIIDPLLLGLDTAPIEIFHHFNRAKFLKSIEDASNIERGKENQGSYEEITQKNGVTLKYLFGASGLPVRFVAFDQGDKRPIIREVRFDYESKVTGAERLPTKIDLKNLEDGKVTLHEQIEVQWVNINEPFGVDLCSWANLEPLVGSRLIVDDHDQLARSLFWDGKSFEPLNRIRARAVQARSGGDGYSTADVLFWGSANLGIVCLGIMSYRFVGRMRAKGGA